MSRNPTPLQWPEGQLRTRYRDQSRFDKSRGFTAARDGILHELDLYGASHVTITSNLPVNTRGLPYMAGQISDPGIAVWWVKKGTEHVLACDRWVTVIENTRAIEMTLGAIRGIARWGSTEMVERAFAGFAALPPGSGDSTAYTMPPPKPKTWRELFGVNIAPWTDLPRDDLFAVVKGRHRELIKEHHPDRVSSTDDAKRAAALEMTMTLNTALQLAEIELFLKEPKQ